MAGKALSISSGSVVIDTLVDSDITIATAINAVGTISSVYAMSVVPISNTKAKVLVIYKSGYETP